MKTATAPLHPLFDRESRCNALRGEGHEAQVMDAFLYHLYLSKNHNLDGRTGPVPPPQAHWFPAEGPEYRAPAEPLDVLVFLCARGASADEPPSARGSFATRLVLVSAETDNFVGLPWGVAERQALKSALGPALSEPLRAQALLLTPSSFLRLAGALGVPPPTAQLPERLALLSQALTPRVLADVENVAACLACRPDFQGEIDITGTAHFPWYPGPRRFLALPPAPR